MTGVCWVLACVATYRAALLVTADEITRPLRESALSALQDGAQAPVEGSWQERLSVLLTCHWCASVWLAVPIVGSGLAWSNGWGWQLAAGSLTAAGVAGFAGRYAAPD